MRAVLSYRQALLALHAPLQTGTLRLPALNERFFVYVPPLMTISCPGVQPWLLTNACNLNGSTECLRPAAGIHQAHISGHERQHDQVSERPPLLLCSHYAGILAGAKGPCFAEPNGGWNNGSPVGEGIADRRQEFSIAETLFPLSAIEKVFATWRGYFLSRNRETCSLCGHCEESL